MKDYKLSEIIEYCKKQQKKSRTVCVSCKFRPFCNNLKIMPFAWQRIHEIEKVEVN